MEIKLFDFVAGDWEAEFNKGLAARAGFGDNSYTQVAGVVLGTPWDEFTYKEYLYDMAFERADVAVLSTGLEKQIDNGLFQNIQQLMNFHRENPKLSMNRFNAFLEGKQLFPLRENEYYPRMREAFTEMLKTFEARHGGLFHRELHRIFTDTVKWSWTYLKEWVEKIDWKAQPIRVIWYGEATKSEVYFLHYLVCCGIDVLVFHPEAKNIFSEDLAGVEIPVRTYPNTLPCEPLSSEKPNREATIAARATAELNQMIGQDGSYIYRPWQFRNHSLQKITLNTTYDEVRIIGLAKAFIRTGFKVEDKTVFVPVLFSKICGISRDKVEYAGYYREFAEATLSYKINRFPFTRDCTGYHRFHMDKVSTNGMIDAKKVMNADWWKYKQLPEGLQTGFACAISRCVANPRILAASPGDDTGLYLFSQALEIPKDILKLLQKFDYSQDVPKILLFNNGNTGEFSRSDAALLLFLNELGVDIVMYNPTGQRDLELFIEDKHFDTHWLEDMSFDESHEGILELACGRSRRRNAVKSFFGRLVNKNS